jgi:hypothetical protein
MERLPLVSSMVTPIVAFLSEEPNAGPLLTLTESSVDLAAHSYFPWGQEATKFVRYLRLLRMLEKRRKLTGATG